MIAIVQYGLGNTQAIANIYRRLNIPAMMAVKPSDLDGADHLILPGVGAFDWAMSCLNNSGMRDALEHSVFHHRKPLLGICVGMQMLARGSEEGKLDGLGWIHGEVRRFDESKISSRTHLPHMGWNDVQPNDDTGLFAELQSASRFYFLHSYYFAPARPANVLAVTDYFGRFASSVRSENVHGVQFHPEKSHQWGIKLLKNFAEL
jgi:glutamine amidotransferase